MATPRKNPARKPAAAVKGTKGTKPAAAVDWAATAALLSALPPEQLAALLSAVQPKAAPAPAARKGLNVQPETESKTPAIRKGLQTVAPPPAVFLPQPRTNLIPIGSGLAPAGELVEMICHSVGRSFKRGRRPVTFVEPESLTPFCIWMGETTIQKKDISTGAKYGVNGIITAHGREYGGFQSNYIDSWTIEKMD